MSRAKQGEWELSGSSPPPHRPGSIVQLRHLHGALFGWSVPSFTASLPRGRGAERAGAPFPASWISPSSAQAWVQSQLILISPLCVGVACQEVVPRVVWLDLPWHRATSHGEGARTRWEGSVSLRWPRATLHPPPSGGCSVACPSPTPALQSLSCLLGLAEEGLLTAARGSSVSGLSESCSVDTLWHRNVPTPCLDRTPPSSPYSQVRHARVIQWLGENLLLQGADPRAPWSPPFSSTSFHDGERKDTRMDVTVAPMWSSLRVLNATHASGHVNVSAFPAPSRKASW